MPGRSNAVQAALLCGVCFIVGVLVTVLGVAATDGLHARVDAFGREVQKLRKEALRAEARIQSHAASAATPRPQIAENVTAAILTARRRGAVKRMFLHAWNGYRTYAWGMDELVPGTFETATGASSFGGYGVTLVDSIDLLAMMGLTAELQEAREFVRTELDYSSNPLGEPTQVSAFELTIRHLGGLLGAYTCTADRLYLEKAVQLADRLLGCYAKNIPRFLFGCSTIDVASGHADPDAPWPNLAELGTKQMEFTYLSLLTGNATYQRVANEFFERLHDIAETKDSATFSAVHGLWPGLFDRNMAQSTVGGTGVQKRVSIGADADSFYEYIIKVYLLAGEKDAWLHGMYRRAVDGIVMNMTHVDGKGLHFIPPVDDTGPELAMDHLTCFVGAMLLLGAEEDMEYEVAANVTRTCYHTYGTTATGLGPEMTLFGEAKKAYGSDPAVKTGTQHTHRHRHVHQYVPTMPMVDLYLLRPEALESLYYLWVYTQDPKYREWAWDIFVAIETHCRMEVGYSSLRNVADPASKTRRMESFFLAETVKYLWLIFCDEQPFPLDTYTFNTEAHPFLRLSGGRLVERNLKRWVKA
eukprot:TRINITY_DN22205_c0_g1_i1.p1 TRINITY_DN22205_c0_g1~~TRINITY_DN22205_c0_g1_i1.p1  ORF type:complete len:585 (+),score=109.08 TRINITY_DN22205_c0_g1_i1:99-1853(+)